MGRCLIIFVNYIGYLVIYFSLHYTHPCPCNTRMLPMSLLPFHYTYYATTLTRTLDLYFSLSYFILPLRFYFKYFPIQFISSHIYSLHYIHTGHVFIHTQWYSTHKFFSTVFFVSDQINNIYLASSSPKRMRHPPARCLALKPLITYLLTPCSRVLLEKLSGSAASQEIPRIFGTPRFITVLTSARHLSLSSDNSIQSSQPPPTS